jgi:hypothetical protein
MRRNIWAGRSAGEPHTHSSTNAQLRSLGLLCSPLVIVCASVWWWPFSGAHFLWRAPAIAAAGPTKRFTKSGGGGLVREIMTTRDDNTVAAAHYNNNNTMIAITFASDAEMLPLPLSAS